MEKLTEAQIRSFASPQTFSRGQSYYHSGAISNPTRRGSDLEGLCEGSEPKPYRVRVKLEGDTVQSATCTCLYEFGGYCKHVVALLLKYVYEPHTFTEQLPLLDILTSRSKDDLIALVCRMIDRYPDLQDIIDRPVPGRQQTLDLSAFRRELRRGLHTYEGWGDTSALGAVDSVSEAADEFAEMGDWRGASAIYRLIINECLADTDEYYQHDEEGELSYALDGVVEKLGACLEHLADDDGERSLIFHAMLATSTGNARDLEIGSDVFDVILRYARPQDIPSIRAQVEPSLAYYRHLPYGSHAAEYYAKFLAQLDALENVDPEITLQRLREQELYPVLMEKLLALGRSDEAIQVVRENIPVIYQRLSALSRLVAAGHRDAAVQIAEEQLVTKYDDQVAGWLLNQYEAVGNNDAYLQLQIRRMREEPQVEYYVELKTAALKAGIWGELRPKIIQQLEAANHYALLTRIYLRDEAWAAAWMALEKAGQRSKSDWGHYSSTLDLEVAEQSRFALPERAIPVYIKYARASIDQRARQYYQQAAEYLVVVRDLYDTIDEYDVWETLIAGIRSEFRKLPALQDELDKADL